MNTESTKPSEPVLKIRLTWFVVRCSKCAKIRCEAQPGSIVKWTCSRCKQDNVVQVAA